MTPGLSFAAESPEWNTDSKTKTETIKNANLFIFAPPFFFV
jgi:hypothetical protein